MAETSAIVEYRTYVPYGWLAFTFCITEFSGKSCVDYDIELYRYVENKTYEYRSKVDELWKQIKTKKDNLDTLKKQFNKRPMLIWSFTTKWRAINDDIKKLNAEIDKIEKEWSRLYEGKAEEELKYTREFLRNNGFRNISRTRSGECPRNYEVWEL